MTSVIVFFTNFISLIVIFFMGLFPQILSSKVIPANFQFKFEYIEAYFPDKNLADIEQNVSLKGEVIKQDRKSGEIISRYLLKHAQFLFPLYVSYKENISQNVFIRLPSYFSHDLFHQALINRYGKQDEYKRKDGHAIYIWNNKKGLDIFYAGGCTITCFPMYMAVLKSGADQLKKDRPEKDDPEKENFLQNFLSLKNESVKLQQE